MVTEETREYLRQLVKAVECAEEICNCRHCTLEKVKKQITQDNKDRLLQYLPIKMMPNPKGFIADLGPNPLYWKLR